jgi:hypothetical protein
MYIPDSLLYVILVVCIGTAFPSLFPAIALVLGMSLGLGALTYVVGPYAVVGLIIAAFLVVRAAPYCNSWLKTSRDSRLEAAARVVSSKEAARRAAYWEKADKKLQQAGLCRTPSE